jgi:hypothetical protein
MNTNKRQIALSVLESLREDLPYAQLNNGSRILNAADVRQYINEEIGRIRANASSLDKIYGKYIGNPRDSSKES